MQIRIQNRDLPDTPNTCNFKNTIFAENLNLKTAIVPFQTPLTVLQVSDTGISFALFFLIGRGGLISLLSEELIDLSANRSVDPEGRALLHPNL